MVFDLHFWYRHYYRNGFCDWNKRIFILKQSNSIHQTDTFGFAPIHQLLLWDLCSVHFLKRILQCGADINHLCEYTDVVVCPLYLALQYKKDKEIISFMLENGAFVKRTYPPEGHSLFCIALRCNNNIDVIKMLLDAKCPLTTCKKSASALHCAMSYNDSTLTTDLFQLLIKYLGSSVNKINSNGQSLLCYALCQVPDVEVIKLIINSGCQLNTCTKHTSVLACATAHSGLLKKDIVKLLIDKATNLGNISDLVMMGTSPLHCALKNCIYDIESISYLYDCEVADRGLVCLNESYLHSAVRNPHCTPNAVEFLIQKGLSVRKSNRLGDSPLHLAIRNNGCHPDVIKILIKNGASFYRKNNMGDTPLQTALYLSTHWQANLLLLGGARLAMLHKRTSIFQIAFDGHVSGITEENVNFCEMMIKFLFLEIPELNIMDLTLNCRHLVTNLDKHLFTDLALKCLRDIQVLKLADIFQYFGRNSDFKAKIDQRKLLKALAAHEFNVYSDVIAAEFDKDTIEKLLLEHPVYTVKIGLDSSSQGEKVILNLQCTQRIMKFLESDVEVVNMVAAFYNPYKLIRANQPTYKRNTDEGHSRTSKVLRHDCDGL